MALMLLVCGFVAAFMPNFVSFVVLWFLVGKLTSFSHGNFHYWNFVSLNTGSEISNFFQIFENYMKKKNAF